MTKNKKIVVVSANFIKSGYGKNGKWSLYEVIDQDGVKYSSFDGKYIALLNTEIDITYKEEQKGKYTNRTIVEIPTNSGGGSNAKLDQIISMLERILKVVEPRTIDTKGEEIPF